MVCQGTACHVMGGAKVLDVIKKQLNVEPGRHDRRRHVHSGNGGVHRRVRSGFHNGCGREYGGYG